jgi:acetyl-CoA C-acetyltransferase
MPEAVIVDAVRTPIGRAFKGSLATLRPDEAGAFIVDQLLERTGVEGAAVEEVIAGVGMPQGRQAFNLGRIIALLSQRLPQEVNGSTISRYCASSLDAIRIASNNVRCGQGDVYVAAGVEFVSSFNERTEAAGAAALEGLGQLRELLERGGGARPVVGVHDGPVGQGHRCDLAVEEAALLRLHGELL